jgi:hypothetical protein
MAICVECAWHKEAEDDIVCNNPKMPITDFVLGIRYCVSLNHNGTCVGFKEPLGLGDESIYDTKADEELARIHKKG